MSKDTKFIVGAVAAVLLLGYVVSKASKTAKVTAAGGATEIFPDGATYGWRYFSDGTVIDRYGTYYYKGEMVYNATM